MTSETAALGLLRRLIAIDSVNPGLVPGAAGEAAAARFAAEWVASHSGFAVRVLPHQVDRSCDLLGVAVPAEVVAAAEEVKEPAPPWRRIVLIWAIAMITIPVVAGFGAYFLLSR